MVVELEHGVFGNRVHLKVMVIYFATFSFNEKEQLNKVLVKFQSKIFNFPCRRYDLNRKK